jgi:hypothetical protein
MASPYAERTECARCSGCAAARVGSPAVNRHLGVFTSISEVEAFTGKLEVIADWRDELQRKLDRAVLRLELCGLAPEEQDQLRKEVVAFTSLCRALADTLRRA